MKTIKIMLMALGAVYCHPSFGQQIDPQSYNNKIFTVIGADLGVINPFSLEGSAIDDGTTTNSPLQYSVGLNVSLRVANTWNGYITLKTGLLTDVINTEILMSRSTDNNGLEKMEMLFRKHYVGVPLMLGHSAPLNTKVNYIFQVGLVFLREIGYKCSHTETGDWQRAIDRWQGYYDDEKGWHSTMLVISYGHEWPINDRFMFRYEISWQHRFSAGGFVNSDTGYPFRPYDVFGINVGLGWMPKLSKY